MPYTPETIVSYLPGSYTPGAESALALNVDVINAAWNKAMEQLYNLNAKLVALTTDTTGWLDTHQSAPIVPGSISVVAPTEPAMTLSDTSPAQVYGDFTAEATEVINALTNKFVAFFSDKFPNEQDNYDAAEAYLLAAMNNATSGVIPAAVRAQIIADGRAEIVASANRATAEATTRYAAMRHPLPPGALTGATTRIAQGALDAETTIIRQVAIKDFELAYQKIKDAVASVIGNRASALNATKDYILATVGQGYSEGSRITGTAHQAEATMINAAGGFFNSRINAQELALKATAADENLALDAGKANQQAELTNIEYYMKAFLDEVKLLAAVCTALTNNVRAGASSSYSVNGT